MRKGFTLIELLVVIAILSIVGILVVTIFTRSLRGINKSQIISVLKQNGQSVLENMDKTIRSSDDVVCVSSKNLVVRNSGIYTRYRFEGNLIKQDNPVKQNIAGTTREETDTEFVNRVCAEGGSMLPEAAILTDTNPKTGVRIQEGSFTRDEASGFADQVTIRFNLIPGKGAPAVVAGDIDPVTFETTIQLR